MLNKGRRLNNGTYPLVFQVIHSRRKKLLYTGFRLKEEAFNEAEEKIVDGTDATLTATDITKMNRELRKMKNMIHTRIRQLERTTEPFTVEDVLAQFTRANVRQQFYILRYIDTQIERKKKLKKEGTAAAYKNTRSSLAKFLDGSDIRMPEIDLRFIRRYEDFLYNNGVAENTVSYYLRNLLDSL